MLAGLLMASVLGLSLAWFLCLPGVPRRISAASCARIQPGMTKAEVGAIVGETDDWVRLDSWGGRHSAYYHDYRSSRRATIEVRFDENDRVFDKAFEEESMEAWLARKLRN